MLTSLEQLLKKHNIDQKQIERCCMVCRPQEKDFISLIQWFGNEKVFQSNFDIEKYKKGHRLIPYSKNVYGVVVMDGYNLFSKNGSLNSLFNGERHTLPRPIGIVKFNKEEYNVKKDLYDKFWEWRTNRNKIRLAMEEESSYDRKHAMHLVRLLRMCVEILKHHEVIVKRPDAEELLGIRNGAMTYDEIVNYAEDMDRQVREVWYKNTTLPKKPDIKFAANLLMEVQEMIWNGRG